MTLPPTSSMSAGMSSAFAAAGLVVFERGWLSANNILFGADRTHETVLVDTGYGAHAEQTLALVEHHLGARPLTRIINTHLHSDHCGGNQLLQQRFDCQIDVPAGEAQKVDRWDEAALSFQATGQRCRRFRRTGVVSAGEWVQLGPLNWEVIAAPGHDPESVVLFQPDHGILISADALWENGFGVVFPELEGESAFDDVRATLQRIAERDVRWVIPGHGRPFGGIGAALERAHARLSGFVTDTVRHATHAVKVLVKFHMLEMQRLSLADLDVWMANTPYLKLVHRRYFRESDFDSWSRQIVLNLDRSRALIIEGEIVKDSS